MASTGRAGERRCKPCRADGRPWLLAVRVLLALLVAAGAVAVPLPVAHADGGRYGADLARLRAAVTVAGWPERQPTWCGIAAVAAVVDYHSGKYHVTQPGVAAALDRPTSESQWGVPLPNLSLGAGPGSLADISRDLGTDPRALAFGQTDLARAAYSQVVARQGAFDATVHLVADLVRSQEPIQVLVLGGAHSVLVSGVVASYDPVKDPNSIQALEVWDPGFGLLGQNIQFTQMAVVPLDEWLTSPAYWGTPYSENVRDGVPSDPDPAVGPYAYDPAHGHTAHLWVRHYIYIRPDAPGEPRAVVGPDWALAPSGAVIAGGRNELPTGYQGAAVTLAKGAPIFPASAQSGAPSQESSGVPWWLALGCLPLLVGGLVIYAAARAQRRLHSAIAETVAARPFVPPGDRSG